MIGYVCKYAPVEIFEAMGTEAVRIQPSVTDFEQADVLMHPNMCSFIKAVLEEVKYGNYEGIILTTCCDSTRRLYDVLLKQMPDSFIYMLDVPRKVNEFSSGLYANSLKKMIKAYEDFSGKHFYSMVFSEIMKRKAEADKIRKAPRDKGGLKIGLTGTRCSAGILNLLEDHHVQILFDMTCTGLKREFPGVGAMLSQISPDGRKAEDNPDIDAVPSRLAPDGRKAEGTPEIDEAPSRLVPEGKKAAGRFSLSAAGSSAGSLNKLGDRLISSYAWDLLNQVPCMRMVKATGRQKFIEGFLDRLDGIICHTVKFCDMYAFEYNDIRENAAIPVLQVETDATKQSEGQIRTRVEAFLESIDMARGDDKKINLVKKIRGDGKMYVMGVDSGSTSTNAVILDENKKIVAFDIIRTGAKSGDSAAKTLENVLTKAKLKRDDLSAIISTGYGRVSIPYADENVTEISCHGRGAHYCNPSVRTILDIGGQDSKAIHLNEKGEVIDFVMNDKCAAGTGRFLEMMARSLEIDIKELGPVSLKWKENIEITSMCSVFAESEVISLIAQNKEIADIAHGIHNAIAGKAYGLMKRVGLEETYMMTGGVALNPGVVKAVEEKLGSSLYISDQPELVGAIGAALFALEKVQ